jgi:hypothetical protein
MEDGMSNSGEIMVKTDESKVVKLRIDGADSTVNTIENSTKGERVSLVCPFPALEVDIPVSLGEDRQGTLQRIAVEEDKETGLPRLKLSISTEKGSSEIALPSQKEEFQAQEFEEVDGNDGLSDEFYDDAYSGLDSSLTFQDSEPAWIDCSNLPSPDEFSEHMRSRNRFKIAKRAAWLTVLAVLVCGGYVAERVGLIDVNTVRSQIAGFSIDDMVLGEQEDLAAKQDEVKVATHITTENSIPAPVANVAPIEAVAPIEVVAPVEDPEPAADKPTDIVEAKDATNPIIVTTSLEQEDNGIDAVDEAPTPLPEQEDVQEDPKATTPQEANILLPTRWPVEYATAYRVRDPAGIVVDVPGGLVKREGHLNYRNQTPIVRSAKAIQRETGARFIVFVHGDELPRFVTTPAANGVTLRIYYTKDEAEASDQIASLD